MFGSWKKTRWKCPTLKTLVKVSDRQERIAGWDQRKLAQATVLDIGAGGIGGELIEGIVQKGIGCVHVCDGDIFTSSNLSRQKTVRRNLYKNKAIELCRNMSKRGFLGTTLIAHPCWFQDLNLDALKPSPNIIVAGVDRQFSNTRLVVCRYAHEMGIPAVILGVTEDADAGYVFVQVPGGPCWNCQFKDEFKLHHSDEKLCPGVPAAIDILKLIVGRALFAIDTLLMDRQPRRDWNYWFISLSQSQFGGSFLIPKRDNCIVCGSGGAEKMNEEHGNGIPSNSQPAESNPS